CNGRGFVPARVPPGLRTRRRCARRERRRLPGQRAPRAQRHAAAAGLAARSGAEGARPRHLRGRGAAPDFAGNALGLEAVLRGRNRGRGLPSHGGSHDGYTGHHGGSEMRGSRALIMLLLSLVAGVAAMVLAARWLNEQSLAKNETQVVVAARDIELGQPLNASMVTLLPWPAG